MIEFWNERYKEEGWAYGKAPNEWFRKRLEQIDVPGRALFVAEGQGRNAVYAAGLSWEVSALDLSEEGRNRALQLAKSEGLEIDYRLEDAGSTSFQMASFDLLVLVFAHFPGNKSTDIHAHLLSLLKPGGDIIFEAYSKKQLAYQKLYQSGGPQDASMLLDLEEVGRDFKGCDILSLELGETHLNEGKYHIGKAHTIRFHGRKSL
jgi:hypothetical protein